MSMETPPSASASTRAQFERVERAARRTLAVLVRALGAALDVTGRFLVSYWKSVLVSLVVIAALWFLITRVGAALLALLFVAQVAFVVGLVTLVVALALGWLARPRVRWILPGATQLSFAEYKGAPETVEGARRIVALLRGGKSLRAMGGEISRGALLVGPVGVGKAYLAQCICAEAQAPLALVSASSFRSLGVGMDALMVHSVYAKARRLARMRGACVVYVDDLAALTPGSREALLQQLDPAPLDEGRWRRALRALGLLRGSATTEPTELTLTIGAATTLDALDAALLRPGRFDRRLALAPPDDAHRAEVINYYLDATPHDDISMPRLVTDLRGFTALAIKRVVNEAVAIAHGGGRDRVAYQDLVTARESHDYGARYPRSFSALEKRRLAYHEAGHVVAQAHLSPRVRVTHVTIRRRLGPWGDAFVAAVPREDVVTQSSDEVYANIQVALASRAAEELFLHARLDGAGADLATASQLALRYVANWGMGDSLFTAAAILSPEWLASDSTVREQVERLLRKAYGDVRSLLEERGNAVIALAETLIDREDLDGDDIEQVMRQAETLSHAQVSALASVAEATLFGASAAPDFQASDPFIVMGSIGPERAQPAADDERPATLAARAANAPSTFAASPSQELRADRVIDRAILRAPLRETIFHRTDPNLPAVTNDSPGE